jgi:protein TonB
MYADRYGTGPQIKPGSMGLALATTALPVVALIIGLQISHVPEIVTVLTGTQIPIDPPPQPDPKPVKVETKAPIDEKIFVPPLQDPLPMPQPKIELTPTAPSDPPPVQPGKGDVITPEPVVTPKPVIVGPQVDPRYRNLLQPPYPPEEIRAGNNGRVVVNVLIGTDGRVKQVTRISAASDAFYAAAERQALTKWRFKPATKDGVAIEQWKQMSLSFVLNKDD